MIKIGKTFRSVDDKRFVVDNIIKDNNGTWVFYSSGDKKFNCLIDAFLLRFSEVTNERYEPNSLFRGNTQSFR